MQNFKDLSESYVLTNEQMDSFAQQGFIKLKNVLSKETIDFYRELISAKVKELNKQTLSLEERDLYHQAFLQISNLWEKSEPIKMFVFSRRLAKIAVELLQVSDVRMYHDQALFKEPGGGFTPWRGSAILAISIR